MRCFGAPFLDAGPHLQHRTQKAVGGSWVVVISVSQVVHDWTCSRCLTVRGGCVEAVGISMGPLV